MSEARFDRILYVREEAHQARKTGKEEQPPERSLVDHQAREARKEETTRVVIG